MLLQETEFCLTKTSALFLNSSYSVGKELSQTGQAGLSVFPYTSAALRVRMRPSHTWSFQFAANDAVPGKAGNPGSPVFVKNSGEGAFVIGEVSYQWAGDKKEGIGAGKYTVGAWFYITEFEETNAVSSSGKTQRSTANNGVYFMAEQNVYAESDNIEQGDSYFTRFGFANGDVDRFNYSISVGAVYTGLFPSRDQDRIGVAVTRANNGTGYSERMLTAGSPVTTAELAIELTYRAQFTPWLSVQPDFQHIIHPGTQINVENATTFGTRIEVGL